MPPAYTQPTIGIIVVIFNANNAMRCEPGQQTVQTAWVLLFSFTLCHAVFLASLFHFLLVCSFPILFDLLPFPALLFRICFLM